MSAETRDVGSRSENGEDGEENFLAHRVPELGGEGLTMLLEGVEEVIERTDEWRVRFKISYCFSLKAISEYNLPLPNFEVFPIHDNVVEAEENREPESNHGIVGRRRIGRRLRLR